MPAIVAIAHLVEELLVQFGDYFPNEPARRYVAEYLTGLLVAEHKPIGDIAREFAAAPDQVLPWDSHQRRQKLSQAARERNVTMTSTKIEKWHVQESVLVFDHPWAKVRRDICQLPDGSVIDDYFYWEGGDFAQVFALTPDDEVVLVRQYKHGVQEIVLELPAGGINKNEPPLAAAQRELAEETGFEADTWEQLGVLHVSSAKATTRAYPFLARGARLASIQALDDSEAIEVQLCSIPQLINLIAQGSVRDSHSIANSLLALRALGRL
jgi:8-oxo-dGTP pyrophosphatase MutT (NUDIX family)